MSYLLSAFINNPFARTVVISDSEYRALRRAELEEEIERLEYKAQAHENTANAYRKEIAYMKSQIINEAGSNDKDETPSLSDVVQDEKSLQQSE